MPTQQEQQSERDWTAFSALENDTETTNDFIKYKLEEYDEIGFRNFDLWDQFKDDFESFTEDTFKSANQTFVRKLRNQLRKYGVWVKKERQGNAAQALYQTLLEEDLAPWPEGEVQACVNKGEIFDSRRIDIILDKEGKASTPAHLTTANALEHVNFPKAEQPEAEQPEPERPEPERKTEQPLDQQQQQGHGKELANLARLYTDDMKYSGENDNFDFKLTMFHDLCNRADIPDHVKMKAFPTMLRSLALDYYYANIVKQQLDFDGICNAITNYFEGPEYKRSVLSKWNSTSLRSVINGNAGKSTEECLQILISDLHHLQHGLNHDLRTDQFFHNKLINAYQDIPACRYACYRPSDTLTGLINDLRSSITTFEKSQPEPNQTFLTDRRYHSLNRDNRQRNQSRYRKKRCFVCNREGCWSTKHTREEREESKRRFKERFKERFTQNFDRNAQQYITEYEGTDNNDDEDDKGDGMDEIDRVLENFTIDAEPFSESFLAFETMLTTALADRSFVHTITGEHRLDHNTNPDLDPFAYATDTTRYNDKEFYGIMIDTGASNKSTAGFGQYQAYKRLYDVSLDTM